MREAGTATGWTIYEQRRRYYVRLEQVVSHLSNSSEARALLAAALRDDESAPKEAKTDAEA